MEAGSTRQLVEEAGPSVLLEQEAGPSGLLVSAAAPSGLLELVAGLLVPPEWEHAELAVQMGEDGSLGFREGEGAP